MAVSVKNLSSLDEILSRHGLERKDLERKCPAGVRLEIAEHIIDSQREGEGATYLKLAEAVYHRNRKDLVDKLCEKIKSGRGVEQSIIQGGVNKDVKIKIDDTSDRAAHEVKSEQIVDPDRLFNDLSFVISEKYKVIGVDLGLNYQLLCNELETGKYEMKRGNEKAMKMLQMWQQSTSHSEDRFTYSVLATTLEKYGFHDAARRFCYCNTKVTSNLRSKAQKIVEKHGAPTLNKIHVKQRLDSLEEEITTLSSQLCHEVGKNGVTVEHLLNKLTMLPVALRREFQDSLRRDIATFGDTCKSISHAFHLLINPLTTFLDYKLLEHLISKFGSSQLNQDMADYVDDVNNFKRETTVAELMDHWDGVEDESLKFTELQVRFGEDPTKCTLERLDKHRKQFCSRYKLSELVMVLIHLKPGSFIAFWRIPTVLVGDITESVSQRDDPFFDEENILAISVAGKQIFPVFSHEATGVAVKDLPRLTTIDEDQASGYEYDAEILEGFVRLQVGKYDDDVISTADSGIGSSTSGSVYSVGSRSSKNSEPWRPSREELQLPYSISSGNVKAECRRLLDGELTWREGERAPQKVYSINNAVATHNNVLYINDGQIILVYDVSRSANNWSRLPDCPVSNCSLAVVNNLLTTIGGGSDLLSVTNKLFSFTGEDGDKSWTEEFPPMPTKRCRSTALCTGTTLIVAGGKETIFSTTLTTVEVMNTETRQWSTAADLPPHMADYGCYISSTLCGDQFIVINDSKVFKCPLTALLQSCTSPSSHHASESPSHIKTSVQWNRVADVPERFSTCVSLNGHLIAIPGGDHRQPVYMYDAVSNSWTIISNMSTRHNRWFCYVAVLPNNQLVVVGGFQTNSVEIATLT